MRTRQLSVEFSKMMINIFSPLIVVGIGAARIAQAAFSGSPVVFTIIMAVMIAFIIIPILLNNTFQECCRRIADRDDIAQSTALDSFSIDVVFAGPYALIGRIEEAQLLEIYKNIEQKPGSDVIHTGERGGEYGRNF